MDARAAFMSVSLKTRILEQKILLMKDLAFVFVCSDHGPTWDELPGQHRGGGVGLDETSKMDKGLYRKPAQAYLILQWGRSAIHQPRHKEEMHSFAQTKPAQLEYNRIRSGNPQTHTIIKSFSCPGAYKTM